MEHAFSPSRLTLGGLTLACLVLKCLLQRFHLSHHPFYFSSFFSFSSLSRWAKREVNRLTPVLSVARTLITL